jgi:alanyl-tRNA synthetase
VRRIEALTGQAALDHLAAQAQVVATLAASLKVPVSDVADRVQALAEERRALQNEVAQLRRELAMGGSSGGPEVKEINGTKFIGTLLSGVSGKDLPSLIDSHKQKLGSGVVLLIADDQGKVAVAAGVTPDLTGKFSAVDVLKAAVEALGGKGGGGRPDMAQGGAKDASNADAALKAAEKVIGG